ncbi:helix-turn-helix domain-containing protein [Pseudooceanicola sp. CBS1P-1]|uniref:Helix-turn-helix domain-containing protein n=1 Tax=Pseudooceanicola albus TaxID=2692189 RepID=A0A6L7G5A4_9RHOB|nr:MULTISPECIES: helix-turn-helix domain-containing protein [Pseudooceanicola]MBT9385168.1 helix-turn-helix domain-containing protein [Pseudooceanicola endophyticus]MXN18540.1 helix-turn-helix domain-containing protein [Pseudooceanicola albus]
MRQALRTADQIGEALRRARKAQGLTQGDLSARTNLRVATISSLENGEPGTRLATLLSVLAALELELQLEPRAGGADPEDIF